ncbi:hypothetical protein H5410_021696 [Solanum commersonii]|uniref:Uncharacterized protein n=1 Tax=Solanum commersonii TaxID=4109 RepID=A0A9J5ZEP3_SOLCO|nr:hypothetical protein H5410_021696 [Solanum commersonii]
MQPIYSTLKSDEAGVEGYAYYITKSGTKMQFLTNEEMPLQARTIYQADKQGQPHLKINKCQNSNHGSH